MALGETAKLIVELNLDDRLSGKMGRVNAQLSTFGRGLAQTGRGVGQVAAGIGRIGAIAATAAAGGLAAVVTTAISFEDAFAGVEKTVDATEVQLDSLRETFRKMAREIPVSFEELSALGETAGALGIAVDDIDEFVKVAATLGVTTDVSAQQAATSLGVLSNVLRLTGEDYDRFADVLVRLGNEGASTESAILAIAERVGASASLIGISADNTLAWSAAVANLGIEVEAGGSAIQRFFVESLRNLQDDDTLQVMAETAGVTGKAFKDAFTKDASGALRQFVTGLGKLAAAERLAVLEALGFSDIRITRTLLGLAGNVEATEDAFAQLALAENAATKEAEKRFSKTKAQLTILVNNLKDAAYVIGNELLPVTNELIKDFVAELNKPGTQAGIRNFAKDLAGGIRDFVTELRGADFTPFISALKVIGEVGGKVVDIFLKLPPSVQAALVTGVALNKLSGGLLGAGAGNIAGGVIKIAFERFAARGSSPANPLWVAQIGGVGGVPAAGARGGLLGNVVKFVLGPAAAVIIGAEIAAAINEAVIGPTKEEEEAVIEAIVAGESIGQINTAIDRITAEQNTDDILAQTALIASNIPFIGDALGHVGPKLDEQRKELEDARAAIVDATQNSSSASNAWSARQLAAFAGLTSTTRSSASLVAARVSEARSAIAGRVSEMKLALDRKNFAPKVAVNATIINNVQVNANRVVSQITRARVATGTIPEFA